MTSEENFKVESQKCLYAVKVLYEYALGNNLQNTQAFLNWQDVLNVYSLLPPVNAYIGSDVDDEEPCIDERGDNTSL